MDKSEKPDRALAIPAATVVIFRHAGAGGPPELLMVIRSRKMAFAAGAAVFPGGRVDAEDYELAAAMESAVPIDELAHRIAAIRETLEETGLVIGVKGDVNAAIAVDARKMLLEAGSLAPVLAQFDWQIDEAAIVPFARWYPKNEKLSRVFDTRFYLADLGTGAVDIAVDETENSKLFWASAQQALEMSAKGDIGIIFPTRRNLERLALFDDFAAAEAQCRAIPVETVIPFITGEGDDRQLQIPEGLGYPITSEPLESVLRG
ncbi:NUDIX hydrolase [Altererythrobacter aquiaggeris]|uniref:NUDIX hydrolase n=1 Tax=Aestuarierythrobacter aquiaggeris TaxID=1898396 RepID=UPI003016CB21